MNDEPYRNPLDDDFERGMTRIVLGAVLMLAVLVLSVGFYFAVR